MADLCQLPSEFGTCTKRALPSSGYCLEHEELIRDLLGQSRPDPYTASVCTLCGGIGEWHREDCHYWETRQWIS